MATEKKKGIWKFIPDGIPCLVIVFGLFTFIGMQMGIPQMLNTIMKTAHDLLLNTCFYLMAICVITGAIGKIFVEFGVVKLLERLLRPLMRPLFNLPGVASLGAVMTFLSDNPAIISLSQDKRFSSYFKKYQYISLTNFGTAFGMGLLVIVFMVGQGYYAEPFIGLFGAILRMRNLLSSFDEFAGNEILSERDLQNSIIQNLKDFILEIGKDFTFISEEYRVQVGGQDFYIDLKVVNDL